MFLKVHFAIKDQRLDDQKHLSWTLDYLWMQKSARLIRKSNCPLIQDKLNILSSIILINGAIPVPGPTMMMSLSSDGSLNWRFFFLNIEVLHGIGLESLEDLLYTEKKRYQIELFLKRILNLAKGFVKIHDPCKLLVIDWRGFSGGFVEIFMVWYETHKGSEFVSKFETFLSSVHLTEPRFYFAKPFFSLLNPFRFGMVPFYFSV